MAPKVTTRGGKGKGRMVEGPPPKKLRLEDIPLDALNRPLVIGGERAGRPVSEARQGPVYGDLVDESDSGSDFDDDEDDDEPLINMMARSRGPAEGALGQRLSQPRLETRGVLPFKDRFVSPAAEKAFKNRFNGREILEREVDMTSIEQSFRDNLVKRQWEEFVKVPALDVRKPNYTLAREFLANLSETDLDTGVVRVRGVDVPFTPKVISVFYKAPVVESNYVDDLKVKQGQGDPFEDLRLAIDSRIPWTTTVAGVTRVRFMLKTTQFSRDWKVKARFIQNRLLPKDNFHKFIMSDLAMLYALHFEMPIDLGRVLYGQITRASKMERSKLICIHLLNGLCLNAGVLEYDEDERNLKKQVFLRPQHESGPAQVPSSGEAEQGDSAPVSEPVVDPVVDPVVEPRVEQVTARVSETRAGYPSEFVRTIPVASRNRYMFMDGIRKMLDRLRVQQNVMIEGLQVLGASIPGMPELPVDSHAFEFEPLLEEAIAVCLEEDAVVAACRAEAETRADPAGTSQSTPATTSQTTPATTSEAPPGYAAPSTDTVPPTAEDQTSV